MKADQNAALLGGGDTYNIQNNNFVVTSSQLLEMSQKADEEAKALEDSIHAEFNLE